MERCINLITKQEDLVLDFCSGSGTTGIAAKLLNRQSICIEQNPAYHEIAIKRLKQF